MKDFTKRFADRFREHMDRNDGSPKSIPSDLDLHHELEQKRGELKSLKRSNDPRGRAYGMEGKTVKQILEESARMKELEDEIGIHRR